MKKNPSPRAPLCALALTLVCALLASVSPPEVGAQFGSQLPSTPSTLLRFRVSNSNLGYMLTGIPERGSNLGYVNEGSVAAPFHPSGIVHPPAPDYTPAASEPLVPLYQWRVVQSGRTYYYYATTIHSVGSNYYFEGLVGYVLPAGYDPQTHQRKLANVAINYYYSQRYGLWYTATRPDIELGSCFPDTCTKSATSFRFQGVGFKIPIWSEGPFCDPVLNSCPPVFMFDPPPPPPPPPTCDPWEEQSCYYQGGWWNSNTCSCDFWW